MTANSNRIYYLVLALIFTDTLLYGAIVPLIPLYTKQFAMDSLEVGIVFAAYSVGALVLSIPLGIIAERHGYKKVFLTGMIGLAMTTILYGNLTGTWMLFFSRLLQGIAASASWTAGLAMVAVLYPKRQGEKIGIVMAAMGLGAITGPPVGGFLYFYFGYKTMFIVLAVLCLFLMIIVWRTRFGVRVNAAPYSIKNLFKIRKKPGFIWLGITVVVSSGCFSMLEVLLPNHLADFFGLNTFQLGLVFGLMGLINAFSDVGVGYLSDRRGYSPFILSGLLASTFILPFLALASGLLWEIVFICLTAVALGTAITPSQPLMYNILSVEGSPEQNGGAGLSYGIFNTCFSLGLLIGPITGGALTKIFGLLLNLTVFSAIFAVSSLLFWRLFKDSLIKS